MVMVTITGHFFIDIFQTQHLSTMKFYMGYKKNNYELSCGTKVSKSWKKVKKIGLGSFKMTYLRIFCTFCHTSTQFDYFWMGYQSCNIWRTPVLVETAKANSDGLFVPLLSLPWLWYLRARLPILSRQRLSLWGHFVKVIDVQNNTRQHYVVWHFPYIKKKWNENRKIQTKGKLNK